MIKRKLKTVAGHISISLPDQLNEITVGQLMELQERPDITDIEAISILSRIAVEELKNVSNMDEFRVFEDIVSSLSHQITHLYNSDAIPEFVPFNIGKTSLKVKVMRNLSVEPAGAFMAARDIIAEEISIQKAKHGEDNFTGYFNPSLKACCQVLAQYFYCKVTGKKYNEYDAEEFCAEIKKLRVTEALPIAKHFFTCYPSLSKPKTSYLRRLRLHWKNVLGYNRLKNSNTSTP
jgi:hypothetical protein